MTTKSTKTSARRSRKSSKNARQPIKSAWKRHSALEDTMKIVLPKENPYREGTARYNAFVALQKGKTVGNALGESFEKGKTGTPRNLRRALLRALVHQKVAKVA
jgi:hypothetical protein